MQMSKVQKYNVSAYNDGKILVNNSRRAKDIVAFKFMGKQYISADVKRNKKYSFDDKGWTPAKCTTLSKIYMIAAKQVKVARDCAKSIAVGV